MRPSRVGRVLAAAAAALGILLLTLAMPVRSWRTGEPAAPPLATRPGSAIGSAPVRVWLDTDAACGHGARTDPDDCLAVILLASSPGVRLAGLSTVFGNAPLAVTDSTTRALAAVLDSAGVELPQVSRGAAGPLREARGTQASSALAAALGDGPLAIVALGPLTNVAEALSARPDLVPRVQRLVAVMGRRRGHLFHPVEGGTAHSFLGHGPVFRDFNFAQDPDAVARVLGLGVPVTLVPYEAAREILITPETLDRMTRGGAPARWVAARSREWLGYWRDEIGTSGFYPFDLLAAAYTLDPQQFLCAETSGIIGRDPGLLGWLGRRGLFVGAGERDILYCGDIAATLPGWLASLGLPVARAPAGE